jgi:putative transposase
MGTREHPDAAGYPYFITFATNGRRALFRDPAAGELFMEHLLSLRREIGFLLLAYVVMPDHVHLVLVPREGVGVGRIMQYVKGRFARMYNRYAGASGALWQQRYYETAIRDARSLDRRVAYVHRNPVEAGLVASETAYPFSSASNPTGDLERYYRDGAGGVTRTDSASQGAGAPG